MATEISVPAAQFQQGGRTGYVLSPTIGDMLRIIPDRVNPDVIHDANRRLYIPHGKAFGDYVLNTEKWVSGALLAGVTPNAITYQPRLHTASFDLDEMAASVKLFDGQHRRYGIDYALRYVHMEIENMVARLEATDDVAALQEAIKERQEWVEDLLRQTIVVILYVEEDIIALQQMFADISKVRLPGAETRVRFDRGDAYNVAALELAETHPLLLERVDMERSTLPRGSSHMLTLAQLTAILRTLHMGINARVVPATVPARAIYERGVEFFDALARTSDAMLAVSNGTVELTDLRARGELSVNPTIMRIEAAIWRELRIVGEEPENQVVNYLASIPREPALDGLWVKAGILPAKLEKTTPMGRGQEARQAVKLAVGEYTQKVAA